MERNGTIGRSLARAAVVAYGAYGLPGAVPAAAVGATTDAACAAQRGDMLLAARHADAALRVVAPRRRPRDLRYYVSHVGCDCTDHAATCGDCGRRLRRWHVHYSTGGILTAYRETVACPRCADRSGAC